MHAGVVVVAVVVEEEEQQQEDEAEEEEVVVGVKQEKEDLWCVQAVRDISNDRWSAGD
jgi:hypothetical protein